MASSEVMGMCIMAICGALLAMMVALSQVAESFGQSFFLLYGTANLIVGAGLWSICWARGDLASMPRRCWKWVAVRGLCGASVCMLDLMSVTFGAPLGDKSALMSINVVVSALIGRAVLGEQLRFLHGVGLTLSVVGAVTIAKPTALLGLEEVPGGVPWLGYGMALLAGFVAGGTFIAARKAQDINPMVLTAAVSTMEGIAAWIVPHCGLVDGPPMRNMFENPVEATLLLLVLLVLGLTSSGSLSVGAQLCPAAASSTILMATSMTVSYVAQATIQHEAPNVLSLTAAGLTMAGVSVMAFARWLYSPAKPACAGDVETTGTALSAVLEGDEDDTESLASFVAKEFSGLSPNAPGSANVLVQAAAPLPRCSVMPVPDPVRVQVHVRVLPRKRFTQGRKRCTVLRRLAHTNSTAASESDARVQVL
eukprot:CAMPEP_0195066330 /NCGR_PEP_ID=MMETSP0448-20130528/11712_1 /TAXON_ID=66468 /ORGANISM="Heterocapsa triquestra, Strain CCMP 448" /LENGTH=422 /DNA_ID=CAMNT_0040097565 /DNA_START=69 /DNA_END=1338 /DNA_ORIENTATION=-